MRTNDIKAMQSRISHSGFPLVIDGQWGPKSAAACQSYLRAMMPNPHPWPTSDEVSLIRRFGRPGDESNLVNLSVVGLGVKYEGRDVKTIRCHKLVAESLHRIIDEISGSVNAGILSHYAGCFNFRKMRNGHRMSAHSWGIAIDLAPNWNGNLTPWPDVATMPLEVCEIFSRGGWLSAGPFWSRDSMHFQSTR